MVVQSFDSIGSSSSKNTHMKYIKLLAIVLLSMYTLIIFISYIPNPSDWGNRGRGAFAFFSLLITTVIYSIFDAQKETK